MALEPLPPRVPDRAERVIRFICGAIVGAVLGALTAFAFLFHLEGDWPFVALALVLVTPALFGVLAMKFGDPFWEGLSKWLRWFG
jgi:hypothetical protein